MNKTKTRRFGLTGFLRGTRPKMEYVTTYFSRLFKPTAVFVSFFDDLKKNYPLGLKSAHFTDSLGFRTLIVHTDSSNKLKDFHFITNYVNIL